MRFKPLVARFPVVTTILLEAANVQQLVRMWTEYSAKGQSLSGWICVNVALFMWFVYYWVMLPDQKLPRYCQAFGIAMNISVVLTVLYFRHKGL